MAADTLNPRLLRSITVLGTLAMGARPATDPDLWWHLRTGQLILQNHAIFRTDPYSFTQFGQPWINHEWLADVFMWRLYSLLHWSGLIVGFSLIATAAFMLVFLRCRTNPSIGAIFTIVGVAAAMPSLGARPQVISLLMASICLWILDRWEHQPNFALLLVPLTLVWVNLHAGFAAGFALILCYATGHLIATSLGLEDLSPAMTKLTKLGIAFGLSLVAVSANPYGLRMYAYPFATLTSPSMQRSIQEWASPDFHLEQQLPILTLLLAGLALVAIARRRLWPTEIILLLAATFASFLSVRYHPLSVLITVPILARVCGSVLAETDRRQPSSTHKYFPWVMRGGLILALAIFAAVRISELRRGQAASEQQSFPAAAASFLLAHRPPGNLWNPYDWGGYLIWRSSGTQPVFIDGRADLYGDQLLESSISTFKLEGDWQAQLTRWQIHTALLPPDAPLTVALRSTGWRAIYSDPKAVILTRQ